MIDYKYKSQILKTDLCLIEKKFSKALYNGNRSLYHSIINQYDIYSLDFKEAHKINNARYNRIKRLKLRIAKYLINYDCVFLTLTFNDKTLFSTNEITRRKYVQRFLKSFNVPYVANVDYGAKNHREHYHAILCKERVSHELWEYGSINFKKIIKTEDYIKLAKYISKLTNHAIKETTKRCHLIYSKNL